MSSYNGDNLPVIIGIGQSVHHPKDIAHLKKPAELIELAISRAVEDSGVSNLLSQVDTLFLVNSLSWPQGDPLSELSLRIGLKPVNRAYTWIGATAPQWFVNRMRDNILQGRTRIGLICGGEALYSRKLEARAAGAGGGGVKVSGKESWMAGDLRDPLTALELKYGLMLPVNVYPLFENALRFHEGLSIGEHLRELSEFCSAYSNIAMENPYAWFREKRSADEILNVSDQNRMVSWPYTKLMCSIIEVDQSAALFMTDECTAVKLGVPVDKLVYTRGAGDASDIWHVTERVNLHASPSVKTAADKAMEEAEVSLNDIDYLDFYSCFPCAPRITRNMLDIDKGDPRPLTVTGGMPCFGGPGNNYSLHAICRVVEILRENRAGMAMVQALSWFINKHSVGIYSGEPGTYPPKIIPPESYQMEDEELKGPQVAEEFAGHASVETYTMFHNREGETVGCVIIGRVDDGSRFLAKSDMDGESLKALIGEELIGKRVKVRIADGNNFFSL